MKLEIRETRDEDIEACFEIRASTRENAISRDRLARMGITPISVAESLRSGLVKGWVCVDGPDIVGFCNADSVGGEVLVLAVLPAYEGNGVGKRLLSEAVDWLRSHGTSRIWLAASPDPSTRAHGFYRSQGWQPSGERQTHGDEILVLEQAG